MKKRAHFRYSSGFKRVTIYFIVSVIGLCTGYITTGPRENFRVPSSYLKNARNEKSRLAWDDLPCPAPEEYKRLAAIVHLEIPPDVTDACAHEHHNKIARILSYAESLKIAMPPDWAPMLQSDLGRPLDYFARMSRRTGIDLSQSTAVAYNKKSEKSVYLGGLFFSYDPLEALSILIHEARHSYEGEPGHTTCVKGELPKAARACDQELSIDPDQAGAYSYGAAFSAALGLYGQGLSPADRAYLLNFSLSTISSRFNELPQELAQAFDLIAVLDESGQVSLLHPFSQDPIPLALPFLHSDEKVQRIDFNVKNNGLLLFTTKNRLFTWGTNSNIENFGRFERIYANTIPESMQIFDAARIRVPFDDYPFYSFLAPENQIYYYRFSSEKLIYELAPYPEYPGNPMPDISRFFMGLIGRSLFLGKDGVLYAGTRFGTEPPFDPRTDLQVPGRRWIFGTGGVVFEGLYAIADDGRVYYTKIDLLHPEGERALPTEIYTMKESALQAPGGRMGRKLYEGVSLRALLDSEGDLQIDNYGRENHTFWRKLQGRVVDFTILRRHMVSRVLAPTEIRTHFSAVCQVATPLPDPWLGIGLGLNLNGELIIGSPDQEQPCIMAGAHRFRDVKFRATRSQRSGPGANEHPNTIGSDHSDHSRALLEVTETNGEVKPLLPYDYK